MSDVVKGRTRMGWLVPLLLATVLALTPGAQACSQTTTGTLLVPTGSPNPPAFSSFPLTQGIASYFVFSVPKGTGYELLASGGVSSACILSQCVVSPDFNVAWFKTGGTFDEQIVNHATLGDQTGIIPTNADYGLVYMRYGPDILLDDDALQAQFTLRMGC